MGRGPRLSELRVPVCPGRTPHNAPEPWDTASWWERDCPLKKCHQVETDRGRHSRETQDERAGRSVSKCHRQGNRSSWRNLAVDAGAMADPPFGCDTAVQSRLAASPGATIRATKVRSRTALGRRTRFSMSSPSPITSLVPCSPTAVGYSTWMWVSWSSVTAASSIPVSECAGFPHDSHGPARGSGSRQSWQYQPGSS